MTIATTTSAIQIEGNSSAFQFSFPFVWYNSADIAVYYTDANGNISQLTSTQYTIVLNAVGAGQLWGIGGTVTYPLSGSPIAVGTYITIVRTVPDTQETSISNQGTFYPQTVERGLDILCLEIQQLAYGLSRTLEVPIGSPLTPLQYIEALIAALIPAGGSSPMTGNIAPVTSNYAIGANDLTLLVDATSGPITVTLPSPLTGAGRFLNVKKVDSTTNAVTFSGSVDGSSSYSLNFKNQSVSLQGAFTYWAVL